MHYLNAWPLCDSVHCWVRHNTIMWYNYINIPLRRAYLVSSWLWHPACLSCGSGIIPGAHIPFIRSWPPACPITPLWVPRLYTPPPQGLQQGLGGGLNDRLGFECKSYCLMLNVQTQGLGCLLCYVENKLSLSTHINIEKNNLRWACLNRGAC